jgi:oligopeptidase B
MPLLGTCASCASPTMKPPVAERISYTQTVHGNTRSDDYHWLRDRNDPKVIEYLQAENEYTLALMAHTKPLQERLFEEMKGRIKETDLTVPVKIDDYYYYTRTFEGKQYRVHCRKRGSLDSKEEILLDQNELAQGHDFLRVGAFKVSPSHRLLAYSTDTAGAEMFTLRIKDLENGKLLSDEIPNTYYSVVWANDDRTVFYTTLDSAKRPYKVFRHVLGTDPSTDQLVHHEQDEKYHVSISKTRSRRFIILSSNSMVTHEVRYLDADRPTGEFKVVHPRQQGMEYSVEHHGDHFYIVTNDEARNFKLMKAPTAKPSKDNWTEIIAHRPTVKIDDVDAFQDYLVVYEREAGLRKMRVRSLADGKEFYPPFPEPVYTFSPTDNEEFATSVVRFNYTSLVTPMSVFDYDMKTQTRELKKQDEVLGGYDPSQYQSERLSATAADGTVIPISLVYKKGMVRNGTSPMLLYGYGSYGASMDPRFSSNRLSLLDRRFIYAIAHIRGGGEMGRQWYEDGKLLNKKHTFTDFIACAEHLIAQRYSSPGRLAIQGGSAGGLLMGAVTNMRPDLFEIVVAQVPFVDVMNTMLDASIPLTVIEYEEWGNPNDPTYYDYMLSYSPYDNVEPKAYPNILITAGLNDPRVAYWEPAKWTARLRATKTDDNRLLMRTNMGAGHGGASGRYDYLKEIAFDYAFILDSLGVVR